MLSQRELGWAAGFLEGEGCFTAKKMDIQCTQVQREPLERLAKMFGGNIAGPVTYRSGQQPYFHWALSGYRAAGLMMTLWSLMSPRRRQQIEASLAIWKPKQVRSKIRNDARG